MPLARLGRNAARHKLKRGSRNPSLLSSYPENGITVFTPGEAMPDAH